MNLFLKAEAVKTRKKSVETIEQKQLKQIRKILPSHVVEIELDVNEINNRKIHKINEHLRIIRNTVLGQVKKNYDQMIRTKQYKRLNKQYSKVAERLKKETDIPTIKKLAKQKNELKKVHEVMNKSFNVTFDYVRKYGEYLRKQYFELADAVTVLSVCETVWRTIEKLLYHNAKKVRFYKRIDFVTFQGKQANRSILLKYENKNKGVYVRFAGMDLPVIVKKDDLFIQETLTNIQYYTEHQKEMDCENIERYTSEKTLQSTYRIRNNRIIRKMIRGRERFFVQIVLEGLAVPKRRKDGSFRHQLGKGRVAADVGTQSVAMVSPETVVLKNLAERSKKSFQVEHKIQRDMYSSFLLYCSNDSSPEPVQKTCIQFFPSFLELHDQCIDKIKNDRKVVLNSGIKIK